jgi:hypothetical protein
MSWLAAIGWLVVFLAGLTALDFFFHWLRAKSKPAYYVVVVIFTLAAWMWFVISLHNWK